MSACGEGNVAGVAGGKEGLAVARVGDTGQEEVLVHAPPRLARRNSILVKDFFQGNTYG